MLMFDGVFDVHGQHPHFVCSFGFGFGFGDVGATRVTGPPVDCDGLAGRCHKSHTLCDHERFSRSLVWRIRVPPFTRRNGNPSVLKGGLSKGGAIRQARSG